MLDNYGLNALNDKTCENLNSGLPYRSVTSSAQLYGHVVQKWLNLEKSTYLKYWSTFIVKLKL